jgi:hypothetical protein
MTTSSLHLYPATVPGGSIIGTVNSRFATAAVSPNVSVYYTEPSSNSDSHLEPTQAKTKGDAATQSTHADALAAINSLPRAKMEALVTRAWLQTVQNQSEDNLRNLLFGAVKHQILSEDDISNTFTDSFTCLPLKVLPCSADGRYNSESSPLSRFGKELYFSLEFIDHSFVSLTMRNFGAI